ncbi:MAG: DUF3291 domain-containing protein [Daejeonella sp.]
MIVSLTLVRYRRLFIPFALMAMALHRLPLFFTKKCSFWKLLGCGKNGTFDLKPDWQQWGLMAVWDKQDEFNEFYNSSFISKWWKLFSYEKYTILCEPLASHGQWSGKEPFGKPEGNKNYTGIVAVLTRATIRLNKLKPFWTNVAPVANAMNTAPGYITSVGIGEAPYFLQATFSVWHNIESVKAFAYYSAEHSEVIRKTREGNWYSEELFARFRPIATIGTLNGKNPLEGII